MEATPPRRTWSSCGFFWPTGRHRSRTFDPASLGQPVAERGRQQEGLFALHWSEVVAHRHPPQPLSCQGNRSCDRRAVRFVRQAPSARSVDSGGGAEARFLRSMPGHPPDPPRKTECHHRSSGRDQQETDPLHQQEGARWATGPVHLREGTDHAVGEHKDADDPEANATEQQEHRSAAGSLFERNRRPPGWPLHASPETGWISALMVLPSSSVRRHLT